MAVLRNALLARDQKLQEMSKEVDRLMQSNLIYVGMSAMSSTEGAKVESAPPSTRSKATLLKLRTMGMNAARKNKEGDYKAVRAVRDQNMKNLVSIRSLIGHVMLRYKNSVQGAQASTRRRCRVTAPL